MREFVSFCVKPIKKSPKPSTVSQQINLLSYVCLQIIFDCLAVRHRYHVVQQSFVLLRHHPA